jgi:hypothetical protein
MDSLRRRQHVNSIASRRLTACLSLTGWLATASSSLTGWLARNSKQQSHWLAGNSKQQFGRRVLMWGLSTEGQLAKLVVLLPCSCGEEAGLCCSKAGPT